MMAHGTKFLIIGEALVDVVDSGGTTREYPGGSPANVALTLGRLGHNVTLRTALGNDSRGALVADWLRESNVNVEAVQLSRTSTATAHLAPDGSASYVFDLEWPPPVATANNASHIHTGSIGAWTQPGAEAVARFLDTHALRATISFDPNIRQALIGDATDVRDRAEALATAADIIKLSDEDLDWLHPRTAEAKVATRWLEHGASIVVITRGSAGTRTYSKEAPPLTLEATPVLVSDTIGAGDTFTGALLASLADLHLIGAREPLNIPAAKLHLALQRASDAAAITVSRPGANPPWEADLPRAAG